MEPWYAGIDLGGTNVRAAAVTPGGEVIGHLDERVDWTAGRAPFSQLGALVDRLSGVVGSPAAAIGLGATGPVDVRSGRIENPWTLPDALQGDARDALRRMTGLSAHLVNDADAAALAEAWQGEARGAEVVVGLTVGTGVGVGVVRDGIVLVGAGSGHPEAGHLVVDPSGPACYCGNHGCVEAMASGTALRDRARAHGAQVADAAAVVAAAAAGHAACRAVVVDAHAALVTAIRTLVAVHAADHLVLAGGAIVDPARLVTDATAALQAFRFTPPGGTRVTLASLGALTGAIGAARTAMTA